MIYDMKILACVLIISLAFSNSIIFADVIHQPIVIKQPLQYEYNGERIEWQKVKEVIKTINDNEANVYIEKSRRLGVFSYLPGMTFWIFMIAGGVMWAEKNHNTRTAGKIVFLSGVGLFGLGLFFYGGSSYYEGKAIERYNSAIGESNKSSSLQFSPGAGEYTIVFQHSF